MEVHTTLFRMHGRVPWPFHTKALNLQSMLPEPALPCATSPQMHACGTCTGHAHILKPLTHITRIRHTRPEAGRYMREPGGTGNYWSLPDIHTSCKLSRGCTDALGALLAPLGEWHTAGAMLAQKMSSWCVRAHARMHTRAHQEKEKRKGAAKVRKE